MSVSVAPSNMRTGFGSAAVLQIPRRAHVYTKKRSPSEEYKQDETGTSSGVKGEWRESAGYTWAERSATPRLLRASEYRRLYNRRWRPPQQTGTLFYE